MDFDAAPSTLYLYITLIFGGLFNKHQVLICRHTFLIWKHRQLKSTITMPQPRNFMKNWFAIEVGGSLPLTCNHLTAYSLRRFQCEVYSEMGTYPRIDISNSYAVIGMAVTGASWYLLRLARGPDGEPTQAISRISAADILYQCSCMDQE